MRRARPATDSGGKAVVVTVLATLGCFGACGGSTDVGAICSMPGGCDGGDARGGGSIDAALVCERGDTRRCVGASPCAMVQRCLDDRSGYGVCECETSGTGGVAGSNAGGSSGTVGVSGFAGALGAGPIDGGAFDGPGVCGSIFLKAELMPLDMFLLMDQSGSMLADDGNRWNYVVKAVTDAVLSSEMSGGGLGLGYFGLHPPDSPPPEDPTSPGSCNADDYARPDVPIEVLPNGGSAIVESLRHRTPVGSAPTRPALQGAMQFAAQWAIDHPARKTIVVLATASAPQGCTSNDLDTVSRIAAAGAAHEPQILTFVIGVGDVLGLDQVARAGGTTRAFVAPDGSTSQEFLSAMKQIRERAVSCELQLPPVRKQIDYSRVNVYHRPTGGNDGVIYYVDDLSHCGAETGGWYYARDNLGTPASIRLCPASCAAVSSGGAVSLALGCTSVRPPLQSRSAKP